jgi:hypothetical protein
MDRTDRLSARDQEQLSRYLDGELSEAARAGLDDRLAREPELAAALARMRRIDDGIRRAYGAGEAVPEHITTLLSAAPDNVVPLPLRRRTAWPAALAASLVAAVALLLLQTQDPAREDGVFGGDPLLTAALDTLPSRADGWNPLADGRRLRPVLTFPSRDGSWCREYLLREAESDWRGVACRSDGRWETQVLARATFLAADNAYRPAGADDSDAVAGFIMRNAADIALSADAEAALIEDDWRR